MQMQEKRRYVRVDRPIRVRYKVSGAKKVAGQAVSKNIGNGGMCMLVKEMIPVGTNLSLTVDFPGASQPVKTGAQVVWVDESAAMARGAKGHFEAGLKFTSISNQAKSSIINFVYESLKRRKGEDSSRNGV